MSNAWSASEPERGRVPPSAPAAVRIQRHLSAIVVTEWTFSVEDALILELTSVEEIKEIHDAQLLVLDGAGLA